MKPRIVLLDEMGSPVRQEYNLSSSLTPRSAMKKAVKSVLAPERSKVILKNKERKRKCVQAKT